VLLRYPDNVSVHLHLAWIAPKKIREMTLVGTKKMLVYDDVSIDTRIQVFDKGVKNLHEYMTSPDSFAEFQYQIRLGDVLIPNVKFGEPLQDECQHFVQSINTGTRPLTDADNGLRVVRALQAAQESMERGGIEVPVAVPSPAIPALASA
jgi:predicted dehydrogenase